MDTHHPHRAGDEVRWHAGAPAPPPLELRPESAITTSWHGEEPVVSVLCPTYQHSDFIEDALRGILGQVTPFPFELIVRDDGSTDGTADIVADFTDRYPNIIRALLEPENRWRQLRPSMRSHARGRFIARCDGDDYWIDPRKLETQVDTLERSLDAVLSHHQAMVIQEGRIVRERRLPTDHCRDYTQAELIRAKLAIASTMLHRNLPLEEHPKREQILNRDTLSLAQLGEHGGAKWEPDLLPTVYRMHAGGMWSTQDPVQRDIDAVRSYYWIGWYFLDRDREVAHHFLGRGLAWYLRGCTDAGADLAAVLAQNDHLARPLVELPREELPPSLRRLVDERDAAVRDRDDAVAQRDRIRTRYDRLRRRFAVRLALRAARLARPLISLRRLVVRGRASAAVAMPKRTDSDA